MGEPAGDLTVGYLAETGLRTNASGPSLPPEAGVRHGGFLLEQRTDDIDRAATRGEHEPTGMIESGVAGMVTAEREEPRLGEDRKSTRLNSSHVAISYAVFCLKKKDKWYN